MRKMTTISLAGGWQEITDYLARRWVNALKPYVEEETSSLLSAILVFPDDDPLLKEFLDFAGRELMTRKGVRSLFGKQGDGRPLIRSVRRWNEYDFADLERYPVLQLFLDRTVGLTEPHGKYYRAEVELPSDCTSCYREQIIQEHNLRVHGDSEEETYYWADAWFPNYQIAATNNHEIIVSKQIRDHWERAVTEAPKFLPVMKNSGGEPIWQVMPQDTIHILIPPTSLQVVERCPECGRPMIVSQNTGSHVITFGPDRETAYYDEERLTVDLASLPAGDFWVGDQQWGSVRLPQENLERDAKARYFHIRSCSPSWLISQRLLRLLYEHGPGGWHAIPVNGLSGQGEG